MGMPKKNIGVSLILSIVLLLSGCNNAPQVQEAPHELIPTLQEIQSQLRNYSLYYRTIHGFLVPVVRAIPWSGDTKILMKYLVDSSENKLYCAKSGLLPVLPIQEVPTLSIQQGIAKVDLGSHEINFENAALEQCAIYGVVNTLTALPDVEKVQFLFGGVVRKKLKHGTEVGTLFSQTTFNVESAQKGLNVASSHKMQLYFQDSESVATIPVIRLVKKGITPTTIIQELLNGPKSAGMISQFPKDAKLLSATKQDETVTLDFSEEMRQVLGFYDSGETAIKSIVLACMQIPDVQNVEIDISGEVFRVFENIQLVASFHSVNNLDE